MKIGNFKLPAPVIMAPMASYTDLAFRRALRAVTPYPFLACSEMIEPHSILRGGGKKRDAILADAPDDQPLAWQIYGTEPELMAKAAQWLVEKRNPVLIDINMGCPKRKIARRGAGAGLLLDSSRALAIAQSVVDAVQIPVTAKLRLGWNTRDETAARLAPALEQIGIAAITIHGRTGEQGYTGKADHTAIRRVVESVNRIPVIGNGDICSGETALQMQRDTGCAGVMIGRAALRNPWVIGDCIAALTGKITPAAPGVADRHAFLQSHFSQLVELHGAEIAALLFRRWIPQYAKALRIPRDQMVALLQTRGISQLEEGFSRLGIRL